MKRIIFLLTLGVMVLSCAKEQSHLPVKETHNFSINAVINDLQEYGLTKAIGENVIRLSWSEGDEISVVNVTTGKALGGNLRAVANGTSSIFTGVVTGQINANDKLAFIYPAQNYPSEQDFIPVDIDYSVQSGTTPDLIMIAHHTVADDVNSFVNIDVDFSFQMSFMRLNLSQLPVSTKVSSVTMNNVNDHIQLSISGGQIVSTTSGVNNFISFTTPVKTDARGAQSILMGVLPSPATSSRSISATTATNTYSAFFNSAELKVNKYYYSSITGFVQSIMTFKDASVKAKCIQLYDANADGQLSFLEAAAVTDLSVALTKAAGQNPFPTSILHFAELQFFTGLSAIPSFQGYTMLKTVAIPPQISSIPDNAFKGCSALETVIFTSTTPPSIGSNAFSGCDSHIACYVPTESVTDYKNALPAISSSIHDVSEIIDEQVNVTGISLNKSSLTMTEGDIQTLIATIAPDNATNKKVSWTSTDSSVAKVDQDGKVTAVKAGTATITVTTEDGGKTDSCVITVETKSNLENPEEGGDWGWD